RTPRIPWPPRAEPKHLRPRQHGAAALPARVHRDGRARAGSGRGGASFHDSNQNETNGNATFTTTIDFTASDGPVAASHDTPHLLWNGVPHPKGPNAIFRVGLRQAPHPRAELSLVGGHRRDALVASAGRRADSARMP